MSEAILQDEQSWREFITRECGIELNADFARSRVESLSNPDDPATKAFTEKYGEAYLKQVIHWFGRVVERGY